MVHAHQDPNAADVFASGRRRGKENLLRGGLAIDLMFITGEYAGGTDTDNDGILEEHEMIPPEFICPITGRPMAEPVVAGDGHRYEKKAIEGMFSTNMRISPKTGERIPHTRLEVDTALSDRIQLWVSQKIEEESFHNIADKDGDGVTTEEEVAREWARRYEEKYGEGHQGSASLSAVKYKFFQLDKDKSGELDGDEAVELAEFISRSFGKTGDDARAEAVQLIQQLDKDLDGHIGFDEFEEFYKQKAADAATFATEAGEGHENLLELGEDIGELKDENWESKILERIVTGSWADDAEEVFYMFDKDKTGRVSAENVHNILKFIEFPGASLEMAQGMLDDVDGQHDVRDGQITLQEFKRSFQRSFLEPGEGRSVVPPKEWAK